VNRTTSVTFIFYWQNANLKPAESTSDVCSGPLSASSNIPWGLQNYPTAPSPLQLAGNNYAKDFGGPDSWSGLVTQIAMGQPECVEIEWSGGGSHYVAIDGFTEWIKPPWLPPSPFPVPSQDFMVHIEDPVYGPSDVVFSVFKTAYQGQGSWSWTVYSQAG